MAGMRKTKKHFKRNSLTQLGLSLLVIVLLNIIFSFVFTRIDLTQEKRYSLSKATKEYLKNIDDIVYFKVYLEGDFPAGFKRLRSETKEMLDEFRAYNSNIQYRFINPSAGDDKNKIKTTYQQLMKKGLQPTNLKVNTAEGTSQQWIFPGALATYKEKEIPVQLFMNQLGTPADNVLNNSVQNLEYNLISAIRKLSVKTKPRVAFTEGHGELSNYKMADIIYSLSDYYAVERVKIDGKINSLMVRGTKEKPLLNKYELLVIAGPDSAFNEKDKYFIDQFVMHGGKILWLVDPVYTSMDSLQRSNETLGFGRDLNLDDMMFSYGVRMNTNLLLDLNALPIPAVTGSYGGQPQIELLPWYYFPLLMTNIKHPIVNNLNAVKTEFVSSIDTVGGRDIKKTVLLTTSKYSRAVNTPTRISLDIMQEKPDERLFNKSFLPVAVLLEGKFKSIYINRLPRSIIEDTSSFNFLEQSPETKMIIIADADVIKNQLDKKNGTPFPLGYDQYTGETFGNKDFIMNCIDYLCDDSGIISVRSREIKLRGLDPKKIKNGNIKLIVQLTNTAGPVFIVMFLAMVMMLTRKYRYAKKHKV
jgi:ABC-2 type transport system permease protein